ncbi:MAG: alanine--tRNA ligase [Oscillospiraceae bacterium]|nr:alanine--tRNA ligase [Oscillospiraceae bacterium]
MQNLSLHEIREKYLSFFESKGHLRLPSFPLVPQNDNSLLLINAGMAPLKPYFTGKETPPAPRITTCQKCIRTPDIERVGKTARHGTFFEMLGNFSFSDYFKKEATAWAWEFSVDVLELPADKIWISVYEEDDDAIEIWVNHVGVPRDKIVKMGKEDNFWEIGQGPCGPCSELYFDRGVENGCGSPDCVVGCECDRFVEYWNLVFTQFDKDAEGNYNPLAKPNIDTGMGLERMACIMQNVNSLFEVDSVRKILDHVCKMTKAEYGKNAETDVSIRVITDHIRSTVMLLSDGVRMSNEGRGYVLRRLLRRAARHGRLLGVKKPFLFEIAQTVIAENGAAYPNLIEQAELIVKSVKTEEERFLETIEQGLAILSDYIKALTDSGKTVLSGEDAFKLYDTYGFPIDLTVEILEESNLSVDLEKFEEEMNKQRELARSSRGSQDEAGWDDDAFADLPDTEFVGYDTFECEAKVLAVVERENGEFDIIFDKTPFYAESGGQVGDKGGIWIGKDITVSMCVIDTQKQNGKIIHRAIVAENGKIAIGKNVFLRADWENRGDIIRNHSAAHLLQAALRQVLGSHVTQAGSLVDANRVRFDFTHLEAMTDEQLKEVEGLVNAAILANLPVETIVTTPDEATKLGAVALFGEKYGDTVRVLKMGDFSTELCGGCHVKNTGEIGLFKILSESGVAAGVRRIEAITGFNILKLIGDYENTTTKLAKVLKTQVSDVVIKAESLTEELKESKREIESLKGKMAAAESDDLANQAETVGKVSLIVTRVADGLDVNSMRAMGDHLKQNISNSVIVLVSVTDGKGSMVAMATKDAVEKGIHCGNIVKEASAILGGGGGGKPDSAQGSGNDFSKTLEAFNKIREMVASV